MPDPKSNKASAANPHRWEPTNKDEVDLGAEVVLAFHGLMCLCNHKDGFCEIGILNSDPGRHKLHIFVFEVDAGFDPPDDLHIDDADLKLIKTFTTEQTGDKFTDIVDIKVTNPQPGFERVKFFLPSGSPHVNRNDFRFLTDLEGEDFYPGKTLDKNHEKLGPRLHVSDAVFYTLCKTRRKFKRKKDGELPPVKSESIARLVGANIYLNDDPQRLGKVTLTVVKIGEKLELPTTRGKKNLVFVDNSCPEDKCDPEEGDFAFYYDAFTPPKDERRVLLKRTGTMGSGPSEGPCHKNFLRRINNLLAESLSFEVIKAADDTPCGPAGAGASDSLGPVS